MNEAQKKTKPKNSISRVYSFFCWCSGARLYLLKQCPTDYNKYFGIGSVVLFTGLLAFISGSYAFYTIFENVLFSVAFGAFWGILIFFLDWYIVASIRKENSFAKEFGTAFPRLILSVFLAIVITKPLELRIFQNEINQELQNLRADKSLNTKNKIFEEFNEIAILENEIKILQNEIAEYEKRRNDLFNMIIAEAEGRSATNTAGKGPVYKEKKKEFDIAEQLLTEKREQNNALISQKRIQIESLKETRSKSLNQNNEAIENYSGLLARLQALGTLTNQNKYINITNWFIMLLFIVIESSPILVKLMAKKGPYDYLLELEEFKNSSLYYYERSNIRNDVGNKLSGLKSLAETEEEVKKDIMDSFASQMKDAANRVNKAQIEKWEQQTLSEVQKSNKMLDVLSKIKFPNNENHSGNS
jgi:hypothetical protein